MILSDIIVVGFKTLLDIVSITLQDKRENILDQLSKLEASVTLSLNKGKRPMF